MLSDRGVLRVFVAALVSGLFSVTQLVYLDGGALAGVGVLCALVALVLVVARARVFRWLDGRSGRGGNGRSV